MSEEKATGRARGGVATAAKMTPEQKAERARKGALARWGAKPLKATHKGNFKEEFGTDVECYVLDDEHKTAVISQTGFARAIGLSARGNALPRFIGSQAMTDSIGAELLQKLQNPLKYQWDAGGAQPPIQLHGFDGTLLIDLCRAVLKADAAGKLKSQQKDVSRQAAIIIGASAKSGIKGLIYALSGYDATRAEVVAAFKLYVAEEAREYEREFPPQLYEHWYRLYHLNKPERGRPWKAKYLTIDHVYHPLARSNGKVLELTRALKAKGNDRNAKLHQFLSEMGVKALRTQVGQLLGIAGISRSEQEYEGHVRTLFGVQPELPGMDTA
jgi:hypothetical protein